MRENDETRTYPQTNEPMAKKTHRMWSLSTALGIGEIKGIFS